MIDYWEGRFANRPYNDNGMHTQGAYQGNHMGLPLHYDGLFEKREKRVVFGGG